MSDARIEEVGAALAKSLAETTQAGPFHIAIRPEDHKHLGKLALLALVDCGWTVSRDGMMVVATRGNADGSEG